MVQLVVQSQLCFHSLGGFLAPVIITTCSVWVQVLSGLRCWHLSRRSFSIAAACLQHVFTAAFKAGWSYISICVLRSCPLVSQLAMLVVMLWYWWQSVSHCRIWDHWVVVQNKNSDRQIGCG